MCIHHPPARLPTRPMAVCCLALAESTPPSSSSTSRLLLQELPRPALVAGPDSRIDAFSTQTHVIAPCHRAVPFPHPVPLSAPPVPWPEPMPEPFSSRNASRKPLSPLSPVAWPVSLLCSVLCPLALLCAPLCVHPLSLLSSLSPSFSPIPSLRGSSLLSARHACPSRVVCAFCASRVFALVAHVQ